jgi:hypothetical protein
MRNLLRQPLTWMVIAECVVVALLVVVIWNVVGAAAGQRAAAAPSQAVSVGAGLATRVQLPVVNMNTGFLRVRLDQLTRDQVFFEQLEWRIVRNATGAAQRYLETVVLPSITRAERA